MKHKWHLAIGVRVWLLVGLFGLVLVLELAFPEMARLPFLAVPAVAASAFAGPRLTAFAVVATIAIAIAIVLGSAEHDLGTEEQWSVPLTIGLIGALATFVSYRATTAERAVTERGQALALAEQRYDLVVDNTTDLVYLADNDRRVTWVAPSVTRVLGWTPDELVGTRIMNLVHPVDRESTEVHRARAYSGLIAPPSPTGFVMRMRTKAGSYRWMSGDITAVEARLGRPAGVVGGMHDVDALMRASDLARSSEERVRAMMDSMMDPFVLLDSLRDPSGKIVNFVVADANPAASSFLGLEREVLVGSDILGLVTGIAGSGLFTSACSVVEAGEPLAIDDLRFQDQGSGRASGYCDVRAVRVGDGLSFTWRDTTDRHAAEIALKASERRFSDMFSMHVAIMLLIEASTGLIVGANEAAVEFYGYSREQLASMAIGDISALPSEESSMIEADVAARRTTSFITPHRIADGKVRMVEVRASPIVDGQKTLNFAIIRDVTEDVVAHDALNFLATHDALTHLVNRPELLNRMSHFLSQPVTAGRQVAVLFLDLDGLKTINDAYGHAAGDDVLVAVAERISAQVRADDLVARLGGDEYVVVLSSVHAVADAGLVAAKIHQAMSEPIVLDGQQIPVTVSIGLSAADIGEDPDLVLRHADTALYRAKESGRSRTVVYAPDPVEHAVRSRHLR